MKREHYVYFHRKESDGSIFYVGKGKGFRCKSLQGRNPYWQNVVAKHGWTVEIVKNEMPEICSLTLEKILISSINGLVNLTGGGEGMMSGFKLSEETKEKIRQRLKGRSINDAQRIGLCRKGAVFSDQHRARLSAARIKNSHLFSGHPHSEEAKKKMSEAKKGKRHSPETIAKMKLIFGKPKGKDSPNYDWKIRDFHHSKFGKISCTRGELIERFSLSPPRMSSLINGHQRSHKGWTIK